MEAAKPAELNRKSEKLESPSTITFTVESEFKRRLKAAAVRADCSITAIVRTATEAELERLEQE